MGTEYYFVNTKYMPHEAEEAFVCHRMFDGVDSRGRSKTVYRLGIPTLLLFNLPKNLALRNHNNDIEIKTLGDLILKIQATDSRVITVDDGREMDAYSHTKWIESHRNIIGWRSFLKGSGLI